MPTHPLFQVTLALALILAGPAALDGRTASASPTPALLTAAAGPIHSQELDAIKATRPGDFAEPGDYQAYVIKVVDWLIATKPKLEPPRQVVAGRRATLAAQTDLHDGPLEATQARVDEVEARYGGPVADARSAMTRERDAFVDLVAAGRKEARRYASDAWDNAVNAQRAANAAESAFTLLTADTLANQRVTIASQLSVAKQASAQAASLIDEAHTALKEEPKDADIERATRRLADAVIKLDAQTRQYNAAMKEPLARRAAAQKVLDAKLAPYNAALRKALGELEWVEAPYEAGRREYEDLGRTINVLKGTNWKWFKGFDHEEFWREQGRRLIGV